MMNEKLNYEAQCCNQSMVNIGPWPTEASLMDGAKTLVIANKYHCVKCDRYISVCNHFKRSEDDTNPNENLG
jgi:hypothetical protein